MWKYALLFICFNSFSQVQWEFVANKPLLQIVEPSSGFFSVVTSGSNHTYYGQFHRALDYFSSNYQVFSNDPIGNRHFVNTWEGIVQTVNPQVGGGGFYRTIDGGQTWSIVGGGTMGGTLFYIDSINYYHTDWYGFHKNDTLRNDFSVLSVEFPYYSHDTGKPKMAVIGDTILLLVREKNPSIWNKHIIRSTDGGFNWDIVNSVSGMEYHEILFINDSTGFVTGDSGSLLKTTDTGFTWSTINTGVIESLYSIDIASDGYGFAVGFNGTIIRTEDYGNNWSQVSSPSSSMFVYTKIFENDYAYIQDVDGNLYNNRGDILAFNDLEIASFELYPNPSNGSFKIELFETSNAQISLVDILGRNYLLTRINPGVTEFDIDLSIGTYFVIIDNGNKRLTKQLIIHQ